MRVHAEEPIDWVALARGAQEGGPPEVHALLTALRPRIVAWSRSLTGDRDAAEDLTQEVMMRVEGVLDEWGDGGFLPWVHRIAVNLYRDRERVRARRHDLVAARVATLRPTQVVREPDPVGAAEAFIEDLTPRQRAAFQLVDLEGWPIADVAHSMELTESTVRVHLMNARRAVRARILEEFI